MNKETRFYQRHPAELAVLALAAISALSFFVPVKVYEHWVTGPRRKQKAEEILLAYDKDRSGGLSTNEYSMFITEKIMPLYKERYNVFFKDASANGELSQGGIKRLL